VTRDEVPNPQKLGMWLDVNGVRMQSGNTKTMIFGVAKIVSYLSQFMSLQPGDVISTGTPAGVGLARGQYTFGAHLRWAWAIALGYAASIGVHLLLNRHLF
jgi:2-keto-4-pentenoate hydratase/2-oxohepta-3-ene-1,7-dioic acid hydratase in catechol pathway